MTSLSRMFDINHSPCLTNEEILFERCVHEVLQMNLAPLVIWFDELSAIIHSANGNTIAAELAAEGRVWFNSCRQSTGVSLHAQQDERSVLVDTAFPTWGSCCKLAWNQQRDLLKQTVLSVEKPWNPGGITSWEFSDSRETKCSSMVYQPRSSVHVNYLVIRSISPYNIFCIYQYYFFF